MLGRSPIPTRSPRPDLEHSTELTAETLWVDVSTRLQGALNETTYGTWFAQASGLELSDDVFVVGVPNDFTSEWIEGKFLGLIRAITQDVTGRERRIQLSVLHAPADADTAAT